MGVVESVGGLKVYGVEAWKLERVPGVVSSEIELSSEREKESVRARRAPPVLKN